MFAILSASSWLIMSKNDPDQEWWLQFFLYSHLRKIRESRHEKGVFFAYAKTKTQYYREADQRVCFRNMIRTIHLLPKFEISSLFPSSVAEQPGLCWIWSETPKTGFLMTRLNYGKTRVYRGAQFFFFFSIIDCG